MYDHTPILIVGAVVISVLFFSFFLLGWYTNRSINIIQSLPSTSTRIPSDNKLSSCASLSLESHSKTFHFKAAETMQGTEQTECIICLTPFEEEENLRQLHSCRHTFHTPCIDMWLGSHSGCPLCRTQIDHASSPNGSLVSEENGQNQMLVTVGY